MLYCFYDLSRDEHGAVASIQNLTRHKLRYDFTIFFNFNDLTGNKFRSFTCFNDLPGYKLGTTFSIDNLTRYELFSIFSINHLSWNKFTVYNGTGYKLNILFTSQHFTWYEFSVWKSTGVFSRVKLYTGFSLNHVSEKLMNRARIFSIAQIIHDIVIVVFKVTETLKITCVTVFLKQDFIIDNFSFTWKENFLIVFIQNKLSLYKFLAVRGIYKHARHEFVQFIRNSWHKCHFIHIFGHDITSGHEFFAHISFHHFSWNEFQLIVYFDCFSRNEFVDAIIVQYCFTSHKFVVTIILKYLSFNKL
uniref:Uncharacterized protein n=1 Tax=Cacopsylla melanoneura TaxID=428564 RepID=A0A8D8S2D0_9HEMI